MSLHISPDTLAALCEEIRIRKETNPEFYEMYSGHPGNGLIAMKLELDSFLRAGARVEPSPERCLDLMRKFTSFFITYLEFQGCPWPDQTDDPSNVQAAHRQEVNEANIARLREEIPDLKDDAYEMRTEEREDE